MMSRDGEEPASINTDAASPSARPPTTKPSILANSMALLRKQQANALSKSSSRGSSKVGTPRRKTSQPLSLRGIQSPLAASSLNGSQRLSPEIKPSDASSDMKRVESHGDDSSTTTAEVEPATGKTARVVSTLRKFDPGAFGSGRNSAEENRELREKMMTSTTTTSETVADGEDAGERTTAAVGVEKEDAEKDSVVAKAAVQKCSLFPIEAGDVDASRFVKLKLLGKGAIGKVYLVKLEDNSELRYALKVVTKDEMIKKNKVHRVMTEREVLATTAHPYIVAMYASFQTSSRLYYCMEYMAGGEFFRMLQKQPGKRLSEDAARFYAAEVVLALEYLHHMGFVYRDLKPENVLLRGDGHLALADFDLSKQATASAPKVVQKKVGLKDRLKGSLALKTSNSSHRMSAMNQLELVSSAPIIAGDAKSFVGTEEYLAPEVISGEQQAASVDFWTLGIFVYEMIYGETPFKGAEQAITFQNILSQELKFPQDVNVSKEAKDIMRRLLTRAAPKRLGAERGASDVKQHKWFASLNFNLIRNLDPPIKPVVEEDPAWTECVATMADLEKKNLTKHDSAADADGNEESSASPFEKFDSHKPNA
eukprot:CAMPEP_0185856568 /NCGR_PEP_ID=MMETSP1354-20130828/29065_1 /TAXON_ID=708628 /ORGANISM="Erythrolobus madagascarensis, Strain CCMP3276" /LENGTH=594 /DNA_ID=CAMNT_0028558829 /DNA_START=164 /DNA_END=1948 /DNA_ORIENTATION=+